MDPARGKPCSSTGAKEPDPGKGLPDSSQLSAYLVAEASCSQANSEHLSQELSSLISPVQKTPQEVGAVGEGKGLW